MEPPGLRKKILAANVRSDGYQRIQGGRYFIYRPPRTVSQIPSAPVPARLSPLPPRLTSSAPPRPLSLPLRAPQAQGERSAATAFVIMQDARLLGRLSSQTTVPRPAPISPWRQTFATSCRLRRRSEWSLTAARVVTCPTPVHGSALGVDFLELSRLASPDHRICRGERRAGELKEEERRLRCLY